MFESFDFRLFYTNFNFRVHGGCKHISYHLFKGGRRHGNDMDFTTNIFNDNQKIMFTCNQVNTYVFIIHVYIYI